MSLTDARDHAGTVCPDCSAMECPKHRAEHYPPSERPAKIAELEAERRDDRDPLNRQHWLTFDRGGKVVGCYCGFRSDLYQHDGYGDDVVDHLLKVGRSAPNHPFKYGYGEHCTAPGQLTADSVCGMPREVHSA